MIMLMNSVVATMWPKQAAMDCKNGARIRVFGHGSTYE